MPCQHIKVFVTNGTFSRSNREYLSGQVFERQILSNGWKCNIYPGECIKCSCQKTHEGKKFNFKFQFYLGGHVTFKVQSPGEEWKTLQDFYYPCEQHRFPDIVIVLFCNGHAECFVRSIEEQKLFEKYHFKKHVRDDPNGEYEIQTYESKYGSSYKTIKTDGVVKKTFSKKVSQKDGNGTFKDILGIAKVEGASYVLYYVESTLKGDVRTEGTLFSNLPLLEVGELIHEKFLAKV